MKQTDNLLNKKIKILEDKIRKKDQLLKKYKKALTNSNTRVSKIAKELENSLSALRDINKNLVPVRLPSIPSFEFSHKFIPAKRGISGDFFDIIPIKDSMKFGIILSSCNSYSLTSLFLSSFLKSAPNIHKYKTAKDFVSFVAKNIKSKAHKKEQIDLFYGLISRSSFELDYCLTGNIFVGLKRKKEKFNTLKPCTDNLLQTKTKQQFKSKSMILNPKDTLLICSPGIKYREDKNGNIFGEKNIIKSAKKNPMTEVLEMRQNVLFACNEFGKNQINKRDCTILTVKVMDAILKLQKAKT